MRDELDDVKRLFGDSAPTRDESDRMRADLIDHIANGQLAEQIRTHSASHDVDQVTARLLRNRLDLHIRPRQRWRPFVAVGVAAAIVVVAYVGLLFGRSAGPAQALLNIAEVTEALPNNEFAGAVVERRSEQLVLQIEPIHDNTASELVAYQVPTTQIVRTAPDGSFQVTTSYGQLRFFEPQPASVADALQSPFPGEPETATFPPPGLDPDVYMLTEDADVLAERISDMIQRFGPHEIPPEVQTLRLIASLHSQVVPTPRQRSAMLRVIANTDAITYTTDESTGTVTAAAEFQYEDGAPVRVSLTFDDLGWLIRNVETLLDGYPELSVPAGAHASDTQNTPPIVIDR